MTACAAKTLMRQCDGWKSLTHGAPTARAKADEVLTLLKGGMGAIEVARTLKIGRASVYRILEDATAK